MDQFVDLLVVMIVAEYKQRVFDAPRSGQAYDGVPKVHDSRVDLNTSHTWANKNIEGEQTNNNNRTRF